MSLKMPAVKKFRKDRKGHKGKIPGISLSGSILDKGDYGLQAMESGRVSNRQLESVRLVVTRKIKKVGKFYTRVFPDKVLTKKPAEVRMGSGKGSPEFYVVLAKPGMILFELNCPDEKMAREIFELVSPKLSVKTRFITREI